MVLISYQSPPWFGWPLWNICHRWPWIRPTCSWLISGFVIRLTRRVLIVEQEMITLPEHLSSPPVFGGVRITRSLVLCLYFVDRFLCFCSFSFGHCVLCPSIYGFWLLLWYLQNLLKIYGGQNPKFWICILIPFFLSFTNPYEISCLHLANRFDLALFVFRDTEGQRKAQGTCHDKRKPKGQSGMDNPHTHATLGTRHRTKTNKTKTQHRKLKGWATQIPPRNPRWTQVLPKGKLFLFLLWHSLCCQVKYIVGDRRTKTI